MLTPLQKLTKNVKDLGKLIVAKGLKKLPKVQKIAQSGHNDWKRKAILFNGPSTACFSFISVQFDMNRYNFFVQTSCLGSRYMVLGFEHYDHNSLPKPTKPRLQIAPYSTFGNYIESSYLSLIFFIQDSLLNVKIVLMSVQIRHNSLRLKQ